MCRQRTPKSTCIGKQIIGVGNILISRNSCSWKLCNLSEYWIDCYQELEFIKSLSRIYQRMHSKNYVKLIMWCPYVHLTYQKPVFDKISKIDLITTRILFSRQVTGLSLQITSMLEHQKLKYCQFDSKNFFSKVWLCLKSCISEMCRNVGRLVFMCFHMNFVNLIKVSWKNPIGSC